MKKNFVLSHHNYNLSKRWYIRYSEAGATRKIYGYINKHKTIELRLAAAAALIKELEIPILDINSLKKELDKVVSEKEFTIRKGTIKFYNSKINVFVNWCTANGINTIEGLTEQTIINFFTHLSKTVRNGTYNLYLISLELLLKHIDKKYSALFESLTATRNDSVPSKFFAKKDIDAIKTIFEKECPQLWFFCQTMYFTLIRPNELRQLKISDFDIENRIITICGTISKNGKTSTIAMPNQFAEILISHCIDKLPSNYFLFGEKGTPGLIPNTEFYFFSRHKYLLKKYNYDTSRFRLYSWKHTGAVAMVKSGIHIKFIQAQGRWHSLDMVDKYLRQLGAYDMSEVKEKHKM